MFPWEWERIFWEGNSFFFFRPEETRRNKKKQEEYFCGQKNIFAARRNKKSVQELTESLDFSAFWVKLSAFWVKLSEIECFLSEIEWNWVKLSENLSEFKNSVNVNFLPYDRHIWQELSDGRKLDSVFRLWYDLFVFRLTIVRRSFLFWGDVFFLISLTIVRRSSPFWRWFRRMTEMVHEISVFQK